MPSKNSQTYVFVQGAYHGGWCWDAVAQALNSNHIYTPTLTGLSERRAEYSRAINLDTHVQEIVKLIEDQNLKSVHLVGWSYGGMVITGVLAQIPTHIQAITYLDAYLPYDGQSAASFLPIHQRWLLSFASIIGKGIDPPDPKVWGVDDEAMLSSLRANISPQPARTFTQSVRAPEPWPDHVEYKYIWLSGYRDSLFGRFHAKAKADKRFKVIELELGHAAPMTHPASVAQAIID